MTRLATLGLAVLLAGCATEHGVNPNVEPAAPCPGQAATVHLYPLAGKVDLPFPRVDLADGTVDAWLRNLTQAGPEGLGTSTSALASDEALRRG